MYERQAYETPEGGYLFWGGLHVGNVVGGEGLLRDHLAGAEKLRVESVILGTRGFASSPQWRREHLGEGWQNATVRGTPFDNGDMLAAGLEIGAAKGGDWSTCHSVQWDALTAQNESSRELTNRLTRQSYPLNTAQADLPGGLWNDGRSACAGICWCAV